MTVLVSDEMSANANKQYGLILPKSKQKPAVPIGVPNEVKKASVFGEDSSSNSDDDTSTDWMKKKMQAAARSTSATSAGLSGGMKKQAKVGVYALT